ncbi:DUF4132 domain-containing protein [Blastococcus sp. LR1]|uniref:DUF4132 domain-containing protein n=1 Tax=Blastococcus sp. LR1 TaxID=2877000 RepID=UPI001CCB37E2|nr:DUF4132 domain-containing protein [Blastococcus sp. LR1]MCA0146689.1 DUF4132 domain-containing protein [Blastococcus sp. LR1]
MSPELAARIDEAGRLLRAVGDPVQELARPDDVLAARRVLSAYRGTVNDATDPVRRAALLWAQQVACTAPDVHSVWPALQLVEDLTSTTVPTSAWTAEEVDLAARLAIVGGDDSWSHQARLGLPVAAAETLPRGDLPPIEAVLRLLRDQVANSSLYAADRRRLCRRLDAMLDGPAASLRALPPSVLHAGDALGPALRAELGSRLDGPGIPALFLHAVKAPGPRPSAKWRATGLDLLAEAEEGLGVVREVLERTTRHREHARECRCGTPGCEAWVWLHESTARLIRGLLVLAGESKEEWVTPLLGELLAVAGGGLGGHASTPRDLVVANAVIAVLSDRDDAVPYLAQARTRIKHRALLKGVLAALEDASGRAGVTIGQLAERTVPGFGLDPAGERTEKLGEHTAVLAVRPPGVVALSFRNAHGRVLTGVPTAVRTGSATELSRLRAEVKEIKRTLSAERLRIEELLAEDRAWAFAEWREHYRDHPVVGALVRGLLWQVRDGDRVHTCLLTADRALVDLTGGTPEEPGEVRLWHPLLSPSEEVRAWREHLLAAELRQPFKQAFREIYRLTDAEVATGDHSNRFAAHILKAPQAQALMRTRGWTGTSLGYWDGGFEGHVTKPFDGGWRAEFFFDLIEDAADDYGTPSLASSDQVRFSRQVGRAWSHRPLTEVPPLVFSEAMRDVDLFVGVTSIAADPAWITRGAREHETYWQQASFGALTEAAATRREALERLVPRLRIADRCTLTERFLEVRGDLRTYKIHLGSGNILMHPDDEYLCIVPSRGKGQDPRVYLPFEEDGGMLSVILSKAFLLAADRAITDPDIAGQITRRERSTAG